MLQTEKPKEAGRAKRLRSADRSDRRMSEHPEKLADHGVVDEIESGD